MIVTSMTAPVGGSPVALVTVSTDPNWLLSSVAQSAAALVAIIGGFLVSRLVTLAVERRRLYERRKDIADQLELAESTLSKVRAERLNYSAKRFVDVQLKDLVKARGAIEVDRLLGWIPRGSSPDEMRPIAMALRQVVEVAFINLGEVEHESGLPSSTAAELRESGIDVPADWLGEQAYEAVAEKLMRDRRRRSNLAFAPDLSTLALGASIRRQPEYEVLDQTRQDRRIDTERDARATVDLFRLQIQNVDEEIRATSHLPDLGTTIGVLAYLALSGIVFPVTLMAIRPVPDSVTIRALVVAAFVSGLLVLLAHLVRRVSTSGDSARSDGGPPKPPDPTPDLGA